MDVLSMDLQVGFDDPMMAIGAPALKQERMRPRAPLFLRIQVAFGAANGPVDQRDAARQANAACPGIAFQEFPVGQPGA